MMSEECKQRRREAVRRYRQSHKEHIREWESQYRKTHREKYREKERRYRERNREKIKTRYRERRRRKGDEIRAYYREYWKRVPLEEKRKLFQNARAIFRKRRQEAINSLGGACFICNSVKSLLFHHLIYEDDSIINDSRRVIREVLAHPERFRLLCHRCHTIITLLSEMGKKMDKIIDFVKSTVSTVTKEPPSDVL